MTLAELQSRRVERARRYGNQDVVAVGERQYLVSSEQRPEVVYHVDLDLGSCTCADFRYRCCDEDGNRLSLDCKHLIAAKAVSERDSLKARAEYLKSILY